jgi:hypothetical protein
MLIEGIAMCNALSCLTKRVVANEKIGHKIDQQQLPRGQLAVVLYPDSRYQQQDSDKNQRQLSFQTSVFVLMMMLMMVFMFVVLMMFMSTTTIVMM